MTGPTSTERRLALLLRLVGALCLLALVPLFMPREWMEASHQWLGWGPFPKAFIAEYLARSLSSLCAFYGGLLVVLSTDVRRFAPVIRYQAAAIIILSACGGVIGHYLGFPWWWGYSDALACLVYAIPMLGMVYTLERDRTLSPS